MCRLPRITNDVPSAVNERREGETHEIGHDGPVALGIQFDVGRGLNIRAVVVEAPGGHRGVGHGHHDVINAPGLVHPVRQWDQTSLLSQGLEAYKLDNPCHDPLR